MDSTIYTSSQYEKKKTHKNVVKPIPKKLILDFQFDFLTKNSQIIN